MFSCVGHWFCCIIRSKSFQPMVSISGSFLFVTTFKSYPCLSERQVADVASTIHTSLLSVCKLRVSYGVLLLQLKLGRQLGNCLSCRYTSCQVDDLPGVSGALAQTVPVWQSSA